MNIEKSLELLEKGEVIFFATDTLYAISCDACNDDAVKNIYKYKKRSLNKPISIFVSNISQIMEFAHINKKAKSLIEQYMPGALTIILNRKDKTPLSKYINTLDNTIAVRIPKDDFILNLIDQFQSPIINTSANISDCKNASNAGDLKEYFGKDIFIANDYKISNQCSTIIDCTDDENIKLVRAGVLSISL